MYIDLYMYVNMYMNMNMNMYMYICIYMNICVRSVFVLVRLYKYKSRSSCTHHRQTLSSSESCTGLPPTLSRATQLFSKISAAPLTRTRNPPDGKGMQVVIRFFPESNGKDYSKLLSSVINQGEHENVGNNNINNIKLSKNERTHCRDKFGGWHTDHRQQRIVWP